MAASRAPLASRPEQQQETITVRALDRVFRGVFVGGQFALTEEILLGHGIRHVLNVSVEVAQGKAGVDFEALKASGVEVRHVPWRDDGSQAMFPLGKETYDALRYIHEQVRNGENVLVSCQMGISRSPTMVIVYLMLYHGMSFNDALAQLQSARPCVSPNATFYTELQRLDADIRSQQLEDGSLAPHRRVSSGAPSPSKGAPLPPTALLSNDIDFEPETAPRSSYAPASAVPAAPLYSPSAAAPAGYPQQPFLQQQQQQPAQQQHPQMRSRSTPMQYADGRLPAQAATYATQPMAQPGGVRPYPYPNPADYVARPPQQMQQTQAQQKQKVQGGFGKPTQAMVNQAQQWHYADGTPAPPPPYYASQAQGSGQPSASGGPAPAPAPAGGASAWNRSSSIHRSSTEAPFPMPVGGFAPTVTSMDMYGEGDFQRQRHKSWIHDFFDMFKVRPHGRGKGRSKHDGAALPRASSFAYPSAPGGASFVRYPPSGFPPGAPMQLPLQFGHPAAAPQPQQLPPQMQLSAHPQAHPQAQSSAQGYPQPQAQAYPRPQGQAQPQGYSQAPIQAHALPQAYAAPGQARVPSWNPPPAAQPEYEPYEPVYAL
eukprot:RCo002556